MQGDLSVSGQGYAINIKKEVVTSFLKNLNIATNFFLSSFSYENPF